MDQGRKVVNCVDCDKPVDPKEVGNYIEMYGWSKYRGTTGGSNNLHFKKVTGKIMCAQCASDRINGVKGQTSFF